MKACCRRRDAPCGRAGEQSTWEASAMRDTRSFFVLILALGLLAAGAGWSAPAAAEDCPRSFLDERYCDRDGDLTADLPLDENEWVDPETIIFSYTPVEDPSVYKSVWDGFIEHLAEVT